MIHAAAAAAMGLAAYWRVRCRRARAASRRAAAKPAERPEPADNSYCLVCHANYDDENLTKAHQPAGVGCEQCHGTSVKHSGDEDGLTPPDRCSPGRRSMRSA